MDRHRRHRSRSPLRLRPPLRLHRRPAPGRGTIWRPAIRSTGAHQADGYIAAIPRADLVGQDGVAVTDLRPAGTAQIGQERVDVVTEGEYVPQGRAVRVVRSEGYRHVVRGLQ